MRVQNLLYLLLALPLFFASCSKDTQPSKPEGYDVEKTLILGERVNWGGSNSNSRFNLNFVDSDYKTILIVVIIDDDANNVLDAGYYTTANKRMDLAASILYFPDNGGIKELKSGSVDIQGNVNNYKIDMVLTSTTDERFHFTYEGKILNISPNGELPSEPVNVDAEYIQGNCRVQTIGNDPVTREVYNYFFTMYDTRPHENGLPKANSCYYKVDLYSVKGEVDADGKMSIPCGTYTFDELRAKTEYTFVNGLSAASYTMINAEGTAYHAAAMYDSGELVIREDGLTLNVVIGGVQHTVTYNGALNLPLLEY